eukprot:3838297-Pleurochrysis_carterae.AAC.2
MRRDGRVVVTRPPLIKDLAVLGRLVMLVLLLVSKARAVLGRAVQDGKLASHGLSWFRFEFPRATGALSLSPKHAPSGECATRAESLSVSL